MTSEIGIGIAAMTPIGLGFKSRLRIFNHSRQYFSVLIMKLPLLGEGNPNDDPDWMRLLIP
jgi:hypothetical protein